MRILTGTSHRVTLAVLAISAAVGTAGAVTDIAFNYSAPKNGYYMIDPFELTPFSSSTQFTAVLDGQGMGISPTGANSSCLVTGLHFPNAATLVQLIVHFRSGASVAGQPSFTLWRKTPTGDYLQAGTRTFVDDSGGNRAGSVPIAAEVAVINNALYSYGLQVCLHSSADVFYGARIQYTYKNAGD